MEFGLPQKAKPFCDVAIDCVFEFFPPESSMKEKEKSGHYIVSLFC